MRSFKRPYLPALVFALSAGMASAAQAPRSSTSTIAQTNLVPPPDAARTVVPTELADKLPAFGPPREILLTPAAQPTGLAVAADGALWFSAYSLGALGRLDRATGDVSYFPLGTGAKPYAIIEAPDRSILATDRGLNVLHRLNPETGEATRIAMPADVPFLDLANLKVDANGRVWFVGASGWLGSHDLATGATDVTSHDDLQGLAIGAATQSTIWFVAGKSGRMIQIDPERARFNSAALPPGLVGVRGAAAGTRNEIWLSFMKSRAIARFTGRKTWQVATLPWPESRPQALLVREDGSVIIADAGRRKLVRYQPALDRFDEVGELGQGGNIKAMADLGDAVAVADLGSDRLLIFPVDAAKAH
jgi:virginiamycin B lyase